MTTARTAKALPFRLNRMLQALCLAFAVVWAVSAYRPVMPADWLAENVLVFVFLGTLAATYRRFAFSELSCLLIFLFLCLHEWGAHYRYAHVPIGEWMRHVFHTVRNDYDRIVHFAFGALLAYPQRELLLRRSGLRPGWAAPVTVVVIVGLGAVYEMIEAVAATVLSPDAGDAFLGLQGDPWDTHKDMFMALAGSAIAMGVTAVFERHQTTSNSAARERAARTVARAR